MQIKLQEVVDAIDSTDVNTQYYYYIPEERIILKDDDEPIKEKYLIPLPSHKQIDDYGTMKAFIEEKTDGEAKEWLEDRPFASPVQIEPLKKKETAKHNYRFITIDKVLSSLKGIKSETDVDEAVEELRYYLSKGYPIYAVSDNGRYIGYIVCRIEDDVVWLESIYVKPEYRRKGVGRMLFDKAEAIAKEHGNPTLYQYVHPNNDAMILFLSHMGYDVLNLIEIRKAYPEEENDTTYTIGEHTYRY